ncbi:hypothetical protein [Mycolicibacterium pulveris]|uniref:hypothetical protein n=1 Tax=Mycolicibacterium pulveris TaxID=36813 RepID=UPI003CF6F822
MAMSISDIDQWSPESINAVGAAVAARADAAEQASSRLNGLSAFKSWQGAGSDAARARTQVLADGIDLHGQAVASISKAAKAAANEVRQVKTQLNELRSTLGQYGIIVDAANSRVVPPTNLSSMSPAYRNLVQDMTVVGQQSLDKLRQAADLTDAHLADALTPKGDEFDLDTQYVRAQGVRGDVPAGATDVTAYTAVTLTVTQITQTKTWWTQPGGSKGRHCK